MPMIEKDAPLRKVFNAAKEYPLKDKLRRLVYDTPIEVALGAILLGGSLGLGSYHFQQQKEGQIPVAFSEIGATIESYAERGQEVPPLTVFYSRNNDFTMQVFEANNNAFEVSRSDEAFADALEVKMDPSKRIHMQIPEYADQMPGNAQNALTALDKLVQAERDLPALIAALDAVWDESHRDVTHTEWYTTEDCDSEGRCTTTTHTREVYDYTIHTYTYDERAGENAAHVLAQFLQRHPDLNIAERLVPATEVHTDNLEAMARSMKELLKGNLPTQEQALQFANTWATGSNFTTYMPQVRGGHAVISREAPLWNTAKKTAESDQYRTYSSSDSGPDEYQVIERAKSSAVQALQASRAITNGIRQTAGQSQQLEQQAQEFIDVVHGEREGNPGKLRANLMETARDIYNANFKNGFDVKPFKAWLVAVWAVAGTLLGGLIGYGADQFINANKYMWERARRAREEKKRREPRPNPLEEKPSALSKLGSKLKEAFSRKARPEDVTKMPYNPLADEAPRLKEIEELREALKPKKQPPAANENSGATEKAETPAVKEEEPASVPEAEQKKPVNDDRPRPSNEKIDPKLRKGFGL